MSDYRLTIIGSALDGNTGAPAMLESARHLGVTIKFAHRSRVE